MAITDNPKLLDRHLAPGISSLVTCDAPDISDDHPEAPHWLANNFLNSMFRGTYKNKFRQYAANQIYRAQVAFADYHEARTSTLHFLQAGNPHNPAIRAYFKAVSRWESCLLNLQIFIDVMNRMKKDLGDEPVFKGNDGTAVQRAYGIANVIKHFGSDIAAGRHDERDTVPLWLTNTGFSTRVCELTYQELAKLVSEVAMAANELQDPLSFASPDA